MCCSIPTTEDRLLLAYGADGHIKTIHAAQ